MQFVLSRWSRWRGIFIFIVISVNRFNTFPSCKKYFSYSNFSIVVCSSLLFHNSWFLCNRTNSTWPHFCCYAVGDELRMLWKLFRFSSGLKSSYSCISLACAEQKKSEEGRSTKTSSVEWGFCDMLSTNCQLNWQQLTVRTTKYAKDALGTI